jgi:transcriptional regulator GlxA family with amidase domain
MLVERALHLASSAEGNIRAVSELAQLLNVSSRTLERAFRSQRQTTLRDELAALRLDRACRLLAETSDSVTAVAAQAGYCSASKMCDVFRERLGQTPRQYRIAVHETCIAADRREVGRDCRLG